MSLVQLDIRGISYSQTQTGAYALVLNEIDGDRTLPIVIGAFEAQSIAIALESEITPPRPLTHDLFKNFAEAYGITIIKVIIHKLIDGVFFSTLVCEKDNEEKMFDARTSDAIALAIRYNAPIYTHKEVLEKAGVILKQEDFIEDENQVFDEDEDDLTDLINNIPESNTETDYNNFSTKDLELKLNSAIERENYEEAAQIRDELNKR